MFDTFSVLLTCLLRQLVTTEKKLPRATIDATSYVLRTTSYASRTTRHVLRVTHYAPRATQYELRTANYGCRVLVALHKFDYFLSPRTILSRFGNILHENILLCCGMCYRYLLMQKKPVFLGLGKIRTGRFKA